MKHLKLINSTFLSFLFFVTLSITSIAQNYNNDEEDFEGYENFTFEQTSKITQVFTQEYIDSITPLIPDYQHETDTTYIVINQHVRLVIYPKTNTTTEIIGKKNED